MKLHRPQVYSSGTHDLRTVSCVHRSKSRVRPSPFTAPLPLLHLPHPFSLWRSPYCLGGFACCCFRGMYVCVYVYFIYLFLKEPWDFDEHLKL